MVLKPAFKIHNPFKNASSWTDKLLLLGISCLLFKIIIQLAVAIPYVATISYTIHNYVIGFIHLIMLGSITFTAAAILLKNDLLPQNKLAKSGWIILAIGFIVTELLLFGQGTLLWMRKGFISYYYEILLGATLFLPLGLLTILSGYHYKKLTIQSKI